MTKHTTLIALGITCLWATFGQADQIGINMRGRSATLPADDELCGLVPVQYSRWNTLETNPLTGVSYSNPNLSKSDLITTTGTSTASITITAGGGGWSNDDAFTPIQQGYIDNSVTCVIADIPEGYTTGTYSVVVYLNSDRGGTTQFSPIGIIENDEITPTYYRYDDATKATVITEDSTDGWGNATNDDARRTELGVNFIVITGLDAPKITISTELSGSRMGQLAAIQIIKGLPPSAETFTGTQVPDGTSWSQLTWANGIKPVSAHTNVVHLKELGTTFTFDEPLIAHQLTFQSTATVTADTTTNLTLGTGVTAIAQSWDFSKIVGSLTVDLPLDDATWSGSPEGLHSSVAASPTTFKQSVSLRMPLDVPSGGNVTFEQPSHVVINNLGATLSFAGGTFTPHNNDALILGSLVLTQGDTTIAASAATITPAVTLPISGAGNLSLEGRGDASDTGNTTYSTITNAAVCTGTLTLKSGLLNIENNDGSTLPQGKVILSGGGLCALNGNSGTNDEPKPFTKPIEVQGTGYTRAYATDLIDWCVLAGSLTGDANATLTHIDGGRLVLTGDISGYQGLINMSAGRLVLKPNADTTFSGYVNASANTPILDVTQGKTLTLTGGISGSHGLTKQGAGAAILSSVNTYTGTTLVEAGSLTMPIAHNAITTVKSGATLALAPGGFFGVSGSSDGNVFSNYTTIPLPLYTPAPSGEDLGFLHSPPNGSTPSGYTAYEYTGVFNVKVAGDYSFAGNWDDMIFFKIDGVEIFNATVWNVIGRNTVNLTQGTHSFTVRFADQNGGGPPPVWGDKGALVWATGTPADLATLTIDVAPGADYTKFDIDSTGNINTIELGYAATVTLEANATLDLRGMGDATATLKTLQLANNVTTTTIDVTGRTLTNDQVLVAWKGAKPALTSVALIGAPQFNTAVTDTGIVAKAIETTIADGKAKDYIITAAKAGNPQVTKIVISQADATKAYLLNVTPVFTVDGTTSTSTLDCSFLVSDLRIDRIDNADVVIATAEIVVTTGTGIKGDSIKGTLELTAGATLMGTFNDVNATPVEDSPLTLSASLNPLTPFYKVRVVESAE